MTDCTAAKETAIGGQKEMAEGKKSALMALKLDEQQTAKYK